MLCTWLGCCSSLSILWCHPRMLSNHYSLVFLSVMSVNLLPSIVPSIWKVSGLPRPLKAWSKLPISGFALVLSVFAKLNLNNCLYSPSEAYLYSKCCFRRTRKVSIPLLQIQVLFTNTCFTLSWNDIFYCCHPKNPELIILCLAIVILDLYHLNNELLQALLSFYHEKKKKKLAHLFTIHYS